MNLKAKRLLIYQSRVLEAERAFSNLQTSACKMEKKKFFSRTPAWLTQAVYSMNHGAGRIGNDIGTVFAVKKNRKFEERELEGM